MKGAKELNIILDQLAMQAAIAPAKVGVHIERIRELFIPELDRLAAIDSAGLGVVGEIAARCAAGLAGENILQAVHDIKTLLAIVQRQAGDLVRATEIVDERIAETEKWHAKWKQVMAERVADQVEIERLQNVSERARAELDRLAESLRMMQHGETEALKMGFKQQLMHSIFPGCERENHFSYGTNSMVAPHFHSLLLAFINVYNPLNTFAA